MLTTDIRLITHISCPKYGICGWGEHCYKGVRFDAEKISEEASEHPGVNDRCFAPASSSSCFFANIDACAHYRWYLVHIYDQSYEI